MKSLMWSFLIVLFLAPAARAESSPFDKFEGRHQVIQSRCLTNAKKHPCLETFIVFKRENGRLWMSVELKNGNKGIKIAASGHEDRIDEFDAYTDPMGIPTIRQIQNS